MTAGWIKNEVVQLKKEKRMRLTRRRMTLRGVGLEQALLTPCLLGGLVAQMQTGGGI